MKNKIYGNCDMVEELIAPVRVIKSESVDNADFLTIAKEPCISFKTAGCARFQKKGAYVLLDFGKEICGSARLIVRDIAYLSSNFRFTFGESVSEACSDIGFKNATNNHSPRDFIAFVSSMSDVCYASTGFRFLRLELLEDKPALMQNIFAVNRLPYIENELKITSSDDEINKIIDTAVYTLKLNMQNGYFWDGIKRDRLVWAGDMHHEVITSMIFFGKNRNVVNSLKFLRESTDRGAWINNIPTYSAWWLISLCDYCDMSDDSEFFNENRDYAEEILKHIDDSISDNGDITFDGKISLKYFVDWQTYETEDAYIGTAMIFIIAAQKFLKLCKSGICEKIIGKLKKYTSADSKTKQVRAFQILAGRRKIGDAEFLEKDGAAGFSTFMSYYILTAYAMIGGKMSLEMIKQYFGGMLSRGATSFWEDFDIAWLNGSGRIDEFTEDGKTDIHADFGKHCYTGLRHSLCHGWSSGVAAFMVESVFGLSMKKDRKEITVMPADLPLEFDIDLPTENGIISITNNKSGLTVKAPEGVKINT